MSRSSSFSEFEATFDLVAVDSDEEEFEIVDTTDNPNARNDAYLPASQSPIGVYARIHTPSTSSSESNSLYEQDSDSESQVGLLETNPESADFAAESNAIETTQAVNMDATNKGFTGKAQISSMNHNDNSKNLATGQNKAGKVYDIATLLQLRATTKIPRKQLRFSEEASTSFVFKQAAEDEELLYRGPKRIEPSRQPRGPPQGSLLQQDAGFARFLKEHASPPHNRVTAGGRIVAVDPFNPPPVFRIDYVDRILNATHKPTEESKSLNTAAQTGDMSSSTSRNVLTGVKNNNISPAVGAGISGLANCNAPVSSSAGGTPAVRTRVSPDRHMSPEQYSQEVRHGLATRAIPFLNLDDGTVLLIYHGHIFVAELEDKSPIIGSGRSQSPNIGHQVPVPPFGSHPYQGLPPLPTRPTRNIGQNGSPAPLNSSQRCVLNRVVMPPDVPHLMAPPPGLAHQRRSSPVPNSKNSVSDFDVRPEHQVQHEVLSARHRELQADLSRLEKCIALHTNDMDPRQLAQYTASRKHLTEQVYAARVAKKQFEIPRNATNQIVSQGPSNQPHTAHQPGMAPHGSFECLDKATASQQATDRIFAVGDRILPPISHGSGECMNAGTSFSSSVSLQSNGEFPSQRAAKNLSPTAPDFVPGRSMSFASPNCQSTLGPTSKDTYNADSTPNFFAPADVARALSNHEPIVHPDDANYCDEMGFNNPTMPKQFCTHPLEFVEVLKAVREQARRHGCTGGQSKDPSYDAEQDVRWAMQDKLPIPLASMNPEYFAKPSPWDWSNSVFNIRQGRHSDWVPPRYLKLPGQVQLKNDSMVWSIEVLTKVKGMIAEAANHALSRRTSWNILFNNERVTLTGNNGDKDGKFSVQPTLVGSGLGASQANFDASKSIGSMTASGPTSLVGNDAVDDDDEMRAHLKKKYAEYLQPPKPGAISTHNRVDSWGYPLSDDAMSDDTALGPSVKPGKSSVAPMDEERARIWRKHAEFLQPPKPGTSGMHKQVDSWGCSLSGDMMSTLLDANDASSTDEHERNTILDQKHADFMKSPEPEALSSHEREDSWGSSATGSVDADCRDALLSTEFQQNPNHVYTDAEKEAWQAKMNAMLLKHGIVSSRHPKQASSEGLFIAAKNHQGYDSVTPYPMSKCGIVAASKAQVRPYSVVTPSRVQASASRQSDQSKKFATVESATSSQSVSLASSRGDKPSQGIDLKYGHVESPSNKSRAKTYLMNVMKKHEDQQQSHEKSLTKMTSSLDKGKAPQMNDRPYITAQAQHDANVKENHGFFRKAPIPIIVDHPTAYRSTNVGGSPMLHAQTNRAKAPAVLGSGISAHRKQQESEAESVSSHREHPSGNPVGTSFGSFGSPMGGYMGFGGSPVHGPHNPCHDALAALRAQERKNVDSYRWM